MRRGSAVAWWRRQPWTAPESVPAKVKYECVPGLGSPDIGSCENVSFEMLGSEEIVLEPANKTFHQCCWYVYLLLYKYNPAVF